MRRHIFPREGERKNNKIFQARNAIFFSLTQYEEDIEEKNIDYVEEIRHISLE